MRLYIAVCALAITLFAVSEATDDYVVICYYGSWAVYREGNGTCGVSNLEPSLCTHMIYAFVGVGSDANVTVIDPWNDLADDGGKGSFASFNAMKTTSTGTKTLVSIGGWNEGSTTFSTVVADATLRSTFVSNMVAFMLHYGFDGVDFAWEFPNQRGGSQADLANFISVLEEFRTAADENNLIITIAVAAPKGLASTSYNISALSQYADYINLMTFEYHGFWDTTVGHNSPLYASERETTDAELQINVNASVYYWLSEGAPASKLVLGIPIFGKTFTLTNTSAVTPGSAMSGVGKPGPYTAANIGTLGYNEICQSQLSDTWTVEYDEEACVPYAYKDDQWVSYENEASVTDKANYLVELGLAGAMVWSVETDDVHGVCGDAYPLLNALNYILRPST